MQAFLPRLSYKVSLVALELEHVGSVGVIRLPHVVFDIKEINEISRGFLLRLMLLLRRLRVPNQGLGFSCRRFFQTGYLRNGNLVKFRDPVHFFQVARLASCLAKALDEIPKLVFLDSLAFEGLEDVVFDWELIHDFKLLFGGLETRLLLL